MRPWSYSRLSCYESCPKQFWYSYVENMPSFRPPHPAADRGTAIHLEGENYLKGVGHIYPASYQKVAGHIMGLRSVKALPEHKIAVNEAWEIVDWKDATAYYRGIIDVHWYDLPTKTVNIQDFKTGQVYPEHKQQMTDYIPLVAPLYPEAERFTTRLVYIDQGDVTPPKHVEADKLRPIRLLLDGRIANAEADTIFPENPGSACKWCNYHGKHGGPCKVGR